MESDSIDRISGLPDAVLHGILSLLPRKDAVRTSVLSRRWNRIWVTFPVLIFDQFTYTKDRIYHRNHALETFPYLFFDQCTFTKDRTYRIELTPELKRRIGGFLGIVKRSLLRSARCDVGGIKFCLNMTITGPEFCSEIGECFELALRCRATEIGVRNMPPLHGVFPEIAFVSNPLCYRSLQELTLDGFILSEKSINDIFLSCPNIRSLDLTRLAGIRKLDIHKLDRLEKVRIYSHRHLSVHVVDAPKLREFRFLSYNSGNGSCTLSMTSCPGLRELSLTGIGIAEELFSSLISTCPLLERLSIDKCKVPREVVISSKHLTMLELHHCNEIEVEAVEIDAPALLSFKYETETFPRLLFKSIPLRSEIVHLLTPLSPVNTSRFVALRNFLATSTPINCLKLGIYPWEVAFDREELTQVVLPPAIQLQHLQVGLRYTTPSFDERVLLDGLLWSCHPKTISVLSERMPQSFVQVLSESLLEMEKNPSCCGSSVLKCWRHDLKSAATESFEGSDAENLMIRIKLEWDNDTIW